MNYDLMISGYTPKNELLKAGNHKPPGKVYAVSNVSGSCVI